jgi:alcohol dehydrogenase YqhD (iron-dependent ADH family)
LKALEEAAKENKKQELIKNATQAINGLIAITKAQD